MKADKLVRFFAVGALHPFGTTAANDGPARLTKCPGYKASNVHSNGSGLKADLHLAGPRCNAYGKDLDNLKLEVTVETCELMPLSICCSIMNVADHHVYSGAHPRQDL